MSYSKSEGNNQTKKKDGAYHSWNLILYLFGILLTSTLIIIMMASLVFVTIKKTMRLHRPHNILVANMMVADIILALWNTIPASVAHYRTCCWYKCHVLWTVMHIICDGIYWQGGSHFLLFQLQAHHKKSSCLGSGHNFPAFSYNNFSSYPLHHK